MSYKKLLFLILLFLLLSLFLLLLVGLFKTGNMNMSQVSAPEKNIRNFEIYAHRGLTAYFPENTIIGYKESLNIGVHSLDIDVAMTKDGIIVGSHDPYLNKDLTRDPQGKWLENNNIKIIDLTFEELKKYDVGAINPQSAYSKLHPLQKRLDNISIPSLQELIDLIKQEGRDFHKLQIEIKTNPERDDGNYIKKIVDNIISVLEKNNFIYRAELQSFDWRALLYAKKVQPAVKTSFITQQDSEFDTFADVNKEWTSGYNIKDYENSVPKMIAELGGNIWCPYYKDVTKDLVKIAHSYNIKVIPWTVDSEAQMRKQIDNQVDGIITNYADKLRVILETSNLLQDDM